MWIHQAFLKYVKPPFRVVEKDGLWFFVNKEEELIAKKKEKAGRHQPPCPYCDGEKFVEGFLGAYMECSVCHGRGYIKPAEELE